MSVVTIGMLVQAVTGIATISSEVTTLIDQIQSRRKPCKEDIESLRAEVEQLAERVQTQQEELKSNLDTLANTLAAYIRAYFGLEPITDACERLQVYLRSNEKNFAKTSIAGHLWDNVASRLDEIRKSAGGRYDLASINQSGLLDANDLVVIKFQKEEFDEASIQAAVYLNSQKAKDLRECVEIMVKRSRRIGNVLQSQIETILGRAEN